jgi:hypothetical protein
MKKWINLVHKSKKFFKKKHEGRYEAFVVKGVKMVGAHLPLETMFLVHAKLLHPMIWGLC